MLGTQTDGLIYGVGRVLPGCFDKTRDITFEIRAYMTTDAGVTDTAHGAIEIECVAQGEQQAWPNDYFNLDLTPLSGDALNDQIIDTSATIDTDTTGADCNPGDTLYWRWKMCDNLSGSDTCSSSDGLEDDFAVSHMRAIYFKNSDFCG